MIAVFDTLSKSEIKELKKFIRSPFFNSQTDLIQFLDYLVECKFFLKLMPTKEKAFQAIFPKQKFSDVKVRLLMSDLHKLIEQYLICKNALTNQIQNKIQLAYTYRQRKLPKHFEKTIKSAEDLLEKNKLRHAEFYNLRYKQLLEQYQFASSQKRTDEFNLQEISNMLDVNFIALKLRQVCFLLSHQAVYKKEYDYGLLIPIIQHIEKNDLLDTPAIALYYYCYKSLSEPTERQYFTQFKKLIFEHDVKFPETEIRDLYLFAINYCIRQLNEGDEHFIQEGLDFYKQALKKNVLIENKTLSRFAYNNIVAMAIRVNDLEWVDDFIQGYKNVLPKKYRESTFSFNRARLAYKRKNYNEAIQLLQKAEYRDLLNNLISKTLLLKIFYELEEFNLLESHLESMKTFIRRKKIIGYHQTNYLNIIRFTKKILTTNLFDKEKKNQLRKDIQAEPILREKEWLLAQL